MVKGASFNRNTKFKMFECLCVPRGRDTIAPLIGKSHLSQIHAGLFANIKGLSRSDNVTSSLSTETQLRRAEIFFFPDPTSHFFFNA